MTEIVWQMTERWHRSKQIWNSYSHNSRGDSLELSDVFWQKITVFTVWQLFILAINISRRIYYIFARKVTLLQPLNLWNIVVSHNLTSNGINLTAVRNGSIIVRIGMVMFHIRYIGPSNLNNWLYLCMFFDSCQMYFDSYVPNFFLSRFFTRLVTFGGFLISTTSTCFQPRGELPRNGKDIAYISQYISQHALIKRVAFIADYAVLPHSLRCSRSSKQR